MHRRVTGHVIPTRLSSPPSRSWSDREQYIHVLTISHSTGSTPDSSASPTTSPDDPPRSTPCRESMRPPGRHSVGILPSLGKVSVYTNVVAGRAQTRHPLAFTSERLTIIEEPDDSAVARDYDVKEFSPAAFEDLAEPGRPRPRCTSRTTVFRGSNWRSR
ncbi:hypothetical protein BD309DRAFT_957310 [Dichomitus squalens]|uniref:Uncharacterized protein n=1 Tax=Dichomitus squalens TaxID=114155 RepID=A0A4V2K7K1_9APHY|nr:hypothetical protein BD309DRAFT_957310 [Dichomitus squalens]TBU56488.1 hypothetical protein BD310DRAFT_931255 [Dichomitus squalens]